MIEYVKEYLKVNEVEFSEDYKLSLASPVRIGGAVRVAAYPSNETELVMLVGFLTKIGCKYKVLGRMSNVLFLDEGYCGVVIFTNKICEITYYVGGVSAEAGSFLPKLSRLMAEDGICGFEELSGIPGSVAASVIGNAGAFGREMSDLVDSVRVYFPNEDRIEILTNYEIGFEYRNSKLKNANCLLLSTLFKTKCGDVQVIKNRIRDFAKKRRDTQPTDKPSLGSVFKRPFNNESAGALIDSCGLKGFSVGGAAISEKHAGFIVNLGNATAWDYLSVVEVAEAKVLNRFNVILEKEIEIVI